MSPLSICMAPRNEGTCLQLETEPGASRWMEFGQTSAPRTQARHGSKPDCHYRCSSHPKKEQYPRYSKLPESREVRDTRASALFSPIGHGENKRRSESHASWPSILTGGASGWSTPTAARIPPTPGVGPTDRAVRVPRRRPSTHTGPGTRATAGTGPTSLEPGVERVLPDPQPARPGRSRTIRPGPTRTDPTSAAVGRRAYAAARGG